MSRTLLTLLCCLPALALAQTVELSFVDAKGDAGPAGSVQIEDTPYGALLTPNLAKLPPGVHGFHVHEKASCAPSVGANGTITPAGAAGGHWDPDKTGAHAGPYGQGHKGDLPALYVGADGKATYPVLAPRLKAADFAGHALMVHAGGDNHSDHPLPLGGGGARVACGVVK
ncbi:superoxide dismutase family protein [Chromobacterium aquaticum]|uniref:Superoxide dismutase [Cu-Zn] n=1 Tax=Chromobacterium aquaticum TaxID=467180 RepID=A0ABV8ZQB3_9NEIS|nr:superoxide dismutase family protein [Chromobacterium aquaticum]MCD5362839.1 superoxide dismutase family protein [Chromobacterium aquaticum]